MMLKLDFIITCKLLSAHEYVRLLCVNTKDRLVISFENIFFFVMKRLSFEIYCACIV